MKKLVLFLTILTIFNCSKTPEELYKSGVENYNDGFYYLAKKDFKSIDSLDIHFKEAQNYLVKIDSVLNLKEITNTVNQNQNDYNFKQVGYFKNENKLRYFTFYIENANNITRDSIPEDLKRAIKIHGSKQMNTKGQNTVSFYYLSKEDTPNITTLNATKANEVAHDSKPLASVWNYGNGNITYFTHNN